MTKQEERHFKILELLSDNVQMQVTELSESLGVSLVTMRKDLTALEEKKLLHRYQGYVELNRDTPVNRRMITRFREKTKIARAAAELISDGDTVFLESGSCCILLAERLKESGKRITILTNSSFMAEFIAPCPEIQMILLGGEYQPDSMATVGPVTKAALSPFRVRFFFSGTDGYRKTEGFTGDNTQRIEILRAMSERAEKTVVITESEKFFRAGTLPVFSFAETDVVITDAGIQEETERELLSHHIQVIKS